jgi:hypothetical protein
VPMRNVYERVTPGSGKLTGVNALAVLDNASSSSNGLVSKAVASADFTYVLPRALAGSHEVKFGAYYLHLNEGVAGTFTNNGNAQVDEVLRNSANPSLGSIPFHRVQYTPAHYTAAESRAHDIAGYVQDMWRPTTRLTISGGLRIDAISRRDLLFNVDVQHSVELGPRVGATATLDGNNFNVVHAAVGKIHASPWETRTSIGNVSPTRTDTYDVDLDGTFETTLVSPGSTVASPNRIFDGSIHQPYINEATIGYRRQLPGRTVADVSWSHRTFRDASVFVETNGLYEDGVFKGYKNINQNDISLFTNNTYNWFNYNDLTFLVTRQSKYVRAMGSYTRQWEHNAGTWQPNDPSSFLQPNAFDDNHANPNNWRDHMVRAAADVDLKWGLQVAADYTLQTGRWSGPIITQLPAADPAFGPGTIVLTNGRSVSNPLATTARFAYPTRGQGQLRADTLHVLNLRVSRNFPISFASLQVFANVFNVANAAADQDFISVDKTSSSFGLGTNRQVPRAAQVGMRAQF